MGAAYPSGFYVYQLADPRTGLPFYVGKGQRDRAWQHQRDVEAGRTGSNAAKVRKIKEILQSGVDVEVVIVAQYELESDALDHEFRLVDANPTLTNIMPGGIGKVMSPKMLGRLMRLRREKLQRLREKEHAEEVARRLATRKRILSTAPGAESRQEEINGWLASLTPEQLLAPINPTRRKPFKLSPVKPEQPRSRSGAQKPRNRRRMRVSQAWAAKDQAEMNRALKASQAD